MPKVRKLAPVEYEPSFAEVSAWYDEHMHPDVLDLDDKHVYDNVYNDGKWCNIFQYTSQGAQKFVQKFHPQCLIDIAVATSIYRPGPLGAHVDDLYVEAKADPVEARKKVHPKVWEAMSQTYGLLIFQEQLLTLAIKVAGFDPDDSERVRKTILKQSISAKGENAKKRDQIRVEFVAGCIKTSGMTDAEANALFDNIVLFCGYGFNKCFSAKQPVEVSRDSVLIEIPVSDVLPGDHIRTRDEPTGENMWTEVIARHDTGIKELVRVTLDSGDTIECTLDHKFRTTCGQMLQLRQILSQGLSIVVDP